MNTWVYTVTPEFDPASESAYREQVASTGRATEDAGWHGILVPHNFHDFDPWMLASCLAGETKALVPLVAVQPACLPPHAAAAFAAAFVALYRRPLHLNLVAGARNDEMKQIGDTLTHDERYERIGEYSRVLRSLLDGEALTTHGRYVYEGHRLDPRPDLLRECKIFIAGSSPAGMRTAAAHANVAVTHPAPLDQWRSEVLEVLGKLGFRGELGIRIGIVCRPERSDAWALATERFPETWMGRQETLLKTMSPNAWSKKLAELAMAEDDAAPPEAKRESPYWLGAFRTGRASAPFLVGSYEDVALCLREYLRAGARHVLLNGVHADDYVHTKHVIDLATGRAQ